MKWAISGFVLGLALFMLNFPVSFNWVTDPNLINLFLAVQSLGFVIIGLGLAVAVLRYRLYDIDIIIRKTLVYAVLTALLGLVYFGCVILLQSLAGRFTGEQSPLIIVVSTLLIAALFAPLRRRVQLIIDRRFFRRRYDAQQELDRYAQTVRDEVALGAIIGEMLRVVRDTMQPEHATVWLKREDTRNQTRDQTRGF